MADKASYGFSITSTENRYKDKPLLSVKVLAAPVKNPVKAYTHNVGRRVPGLQWEAPEWDLAEVGRIIDVEGYVSRALKTKTDLFVKEGYEFNGPNIERSKYIYKRLAQIEVAGDKPFPLLIKETIASLQRSSNAFWVKVRDYNASSGKRRLIGKSEFDPVAAYFSLPAESIRIKRDEYGRVVKYRQEVHGKKYKDFRPEDIIHWVFDRREGFSVGTPQIVPIKDDIRALRRIEENVELLVYQHLFPLFHYTVGTDEQPATITPDGEDEIAIVQKQVAQMPADGCWVTPHRHKIEAIDAKSPPIAVDKVIEHFKHRIYIGLGVSPIDMGEAAAASRSTAQTLSRNLINSTKAYQKDFGAQFYHHVIRELLLESTFNEETLFEDENKVFLRFKEIDQETKIAWENHLADMFLKNAITHDEFRIETGRQPFVGAGWPTSTSKAQMFKPGDGDFAKTNYGLIERDKIILQSLDEPGTDASKAETQSRTKSNNTKSAGGNSVSNKNQPTNQHGTRGSAKLNKDAFFPKSYLPELDSIFNQTAPLSSSYKIARKEIIDRIRQRGVEIKIIQYNLNFYFKEAANRLISLSKRAFRIGLQKTNHEVWEINLSKADAKINDHIKKYILKLQDEILKHINNNVINLASLNIENAVFVSLIFDTLEHRAQQIDNSEVMRAYNFGLLTGFKLSDAIKVSTIYNGESDSNICKKASEQKLDPNDIIYKELPPHRPLCTCTLQIEE